MLTKQIRLDLYSVCILQIASYRHKQTHVPRHTHIHHSFVEGQPIIWALNMSQQEVQIW